MGAVLSAGGRRPGGLRRAGWAVAACLGLALAGAAAAPTSASAASGSTASGSTPGCAAVAVGKVSCAALVTPHSAEAPERSASSASATLPTGLGPMSLRYAYGLEFSALTGGVGQTVAVVNPYDDPAAETDLATYRTAYHIPACGSGCFTKVDENGGTDYPVSNPGWSAGASEALDMVSAICPSCHILLVEAASTAITDLGTAENTAVSLGAKFVINTYFTSEATFNTSEPTYDSEYFNHPGVAITAPDGLDAGYGTYYPAASPDVIAVGGTTLTADPSSPRGWTETAFSGTGSGCSLYEAKPSWQTDTGCSNRMLNDISAVADPTGSPVNFVDTQISTADSGWTEGGGNDVAAAVVGAAFALAGTPAAGSYPASYLYAHDGAHLINDITSGSNGTTCTSTYFCNAGPGYDGPTGVGTIASATALGAHAPDASLAGGPAAVDPATGSLDVFGTGTVNGTGWGDVWTPSSGWAAWQNMSGDLDPKPLSALYDPASGNIEVYGLGSKGHVEEDYSSNGTSWSGWTDLGGTYAGPPSAVFNPLTDSVDVWEVNAAGTAFVDSWNPSSGWSGWKNQFGIFSPDGLDAVYDPVLRTMQVYGVGAASGTVWGTSYTSATGGLSGSGTGDWDGWTNMGGHLTGVLSAVYDPTDGDMEVYGQDTSGYTEETGTDDAVPGWTSTWHYLSDGGPSLTNPPFAVYDPLDNSLEVWVADGSSETVFDDSWSTPGGWTAWQNRSGLLISSVDPVFDDNSGDLRTFGVGPDNGTVWDATMNPSLTFSSWANMAGHLQSGDF